jgi:hypothetical protein
MFASIYRFSSIMQFDTADTTWTLATACTWCVVEVACGVISACLPTLRPLMMKISNQFPSIRSRNNSRGLSGNSRSRNTELKTIGGGSVGASNALRSGDRHFRKLEHEYEDDYGVNTVITNSVKDVERHSSGDEAPLNDGIRVTVNRDVSWYASGKKGGKNNSQVDNSSRGSTSPQRSGHDMV